MCQTAIQTGEKSGKGKLVLSNEDEYCGSFAQDEKHGSGEFKWVTGGLAGYTYIGSFHKGELQGAGVLSSSSGDSYDGQVLGKMHRRAGQQGDNVVWSVGWCYFNTETLNIAALPAVAREP